MSKKSAVSAIERGDLLELQHVLEESEWDVGSEPLDSKGQSALHIACANGHLDIVQYLVNKKGCSVTVEDVYGHTPLMLSFINKHWKMANFLFQNDQNSAINGLEGILTRYNKFFMMKVAEEALVASCKEGYFELVKYLTDHIPHSKETLQIARSSGNLHIVRYLLKHYQCEIPDDISDVHLECMMGDIDTVKTTLETDGPSILCITNCYGTTPIHYATLEPNILRMIVQYAGEMLLNITDSMGNTPLHHSIKYECIESVTTLVEAPGCDVNLANLKGETPLIAACKQSSSAVVQLLVTSERCDLNTSDNEGQTALHIACADGHLDIVQCLVSKKGCSVTVKNVYGHTPLMLSLINKHWQMANLLSQFAPDSSVNDLVTSYNMSIVMKVAKEALTASCKEGYFELVKYLIKSGWHTVDHKEIIKLARCFDNLHIVKYLLTHCQCTMPDDMSEVHIACIQGVVEKVKVALDSNGPSILGTADSFGTTPIHYAILEPNILRMVVQYAGEMLLNITDSMGNTPLHHSIKYECIETVTILVKAPGCDVNLANLKGETPLIAACKYSNSDIVQLLVASEKCDLHIACAEGNAPIVELLVKNRTNVLTLNHEGNAPIHTACMNSRLESLKVLLSYESCNPNQQNSKGDTALHIVCRMRTGRELQFLEMLTSTPVINSTLVNHEGNAPIHTACMNSRLELLKVLLSSESCDPNQQNTRGETALHIVCRMRTANVLKFLEVLTSTPGINPTLANDKGISPFEVHVNDGNTLLHNACAEGNATMVEILVKNGADVLKPNRYGDTPIHIACKHARLDILKLVLNCTNCDPNQQNAEGDTALHIVCRMRTGSTLQFLEVLTSTRGINHTLVNQKRIGPFEEVDGNGNTLLHDACIEGNTRIARLLLKNGVDVLKRNRHGDAPIHIASKYARLEILKIVLNSTSCDPNQQNARGDTALHIVCRKNFPDEKQLLNTLTSIVGIDPEIVNHEGHTPIEVEGINYTAIDTMKNILEHKKSSIQAYLKIFVVGNSGTGKSTLIKAVTTEASQLRKYAPLPKMRYVNPSDVPPHTAGIVPISFNSNHFGNAVLYDFAGQHEYYSSHAAVMENLILPSPPLFLLLIDISKSKEVIREELVYWWHFINNQSQKASASPHVILAGSHKDVVKSKDREELEVMIRSYIKRIPVTFEFVGYFPLDCRKLVSQGLSALLIQLGTTCQTLRGVVNVNLHCHILNALLRAPEFQGLVYCKLVDIMNKIESDNAPLPKAFSQLIPLLASLNDQGHILLLKNHTDESKSWVILKPDVLLAEVNGSVFAPKGFKEHFQFAMSTGVVTSSKLKQRFTVHDHDVFVEYMTHLEFCFRIKDQHTLDIITNNEIHESVTTEKYYFFPALVRVENPTNVCQPHQSIGYECGWLYKCSKETEQLTTRFLHVLILRLAFACDPPDDPTETESVVLLRSCSVWKHGIAWWTNDGIEVIVEVGLQCRWVAVMLRCPATERVQCAELRSKVISTVLKTKTDFCPAIAMKGYLIAPLSLKYPFEGRELILYSMREVAKVTIYGKKYAKDTKGDNLISLPQLLPFEPYHNMEDLVPKFFSGDTSVAITSEELTQIAVKCHKKLAELNTAFKPDVVSFQKECEKTDCTEVERCVALFHILQRRGRFKTWRDFQQEFSRFSIFCKHSPLVRMIISMLNANKRN